MKCELCNRETQFKDLADFETFLESIKASKNTTEIKNNEKKYNVGLEEYDFLCVECNNIIKIVEPDPPYRGQIIVRENTFNSKQ